MTQRRLRARDFVLIGFGLSGCSFNLVIGALGKLLPASWRSFAFGAGTAAGSFGQFLFSPLARGLIDAFDWQSALVVFSTLVLFILPLSLAFSGHATDSGALSAPRSQSVTQALAEAFGHRSYVLLVLGLFTCGFQLAFITVHLPAYLMDRGLSTEVGAWTIGVIGLFNIMGCLLAGWLGERLPVSSGCGSAAFCSNAWAPTISYGGSRCAWGWLQP
jgi:MFS family permease